MTELFLLYDMNSTIAQLRLAQLKPRRFFPIELDFRCLQGNFEVLHGTRTHQSHGGPSARPLHQSAEPRGHSAIL